MKTKAEIGLRVCVADSSRKKLTERKVVLQNGPLRCSGGSTTALRPHICREAAVFSEKAEQEGLQNRRH